MWVPWGGGLWCRRGERIFFLVGIERAYTQLELGDASRTYAYYDMIAT